MPHQASERDGPGLFSRVLGSRERQWRPSEVPPEPIALMGVRSIQPDCTLPLPLESATCPGLKELVKEHQDSCGDP